MRCRKIATLSVFVLCLAPASALAQGSKGLVEGFGTVSLSDVSSSRAGLGGGVAVNLTPNIQAVGEAGWIGDVLPATTSALLGLTSFDVRLSATYGEGGVRFVGAPQSGVNPYVEGTAGIARLHTAFSGEGSTIEAIVNVALGFLSRTEPMAGVGAGVLLHGGPVVVDVGYRYKQIFVSDSLASVLSLGNDLRSHQVKVGVGVRF